MKPKQAYFWISKDNGVMCTLCPHKCFLLTGETGQCRTRRNVDGKLVSLVYGYPCALQIDPVEKKPLYHFLPGSLTFSAATIGCNLRCLNCQNYHISQSSFYPRQATYVSIEDLVDAALQNKCKSISYTYTDPVVYYEYARDASVLAKDKGLKNIIVSAGYINKQPLRDLCRSIDAANIDLKCFDDRIYQKMSQVALKPVLQTLEILKEEGVWLEITNLIVPEYTDDIQMIEKMCVWLVNNGFAEAPLHFSRFHPSHKLNQLPSTSLAILNKAYQVAQDKGMKYVYVGNVQQEKTNQTYCPDCQKIVVGRKGYLVEYILLKGAKCEYCGSLLSGVWR